MTKRITHTHTRLELMMLKAALGKYADKETAAINALRTAGENTIADDLATALEALVGHNGDREGTTVERLTKMIGALEDSGEGVTLQSTMLEAHAYDVGLPMLARRLRSIEGELRSFGRDDVGEWCVDRANYVGSILKDHYGQQLPLKKNKPGATSQPSLME